MYVLVCLCVCVCVYVCVCACVCVSVYVYSVHVCVYVHVFVFCLQLGLCTFFPPTANSSHTTGVLVLDQHKMCNMLADVLRLTDKISRAADDPSGIFTQADLAMILTGYFTKEDDVDDRLPWQYLSVIESVNICTPLSNGTIFTPSGLAVRFADVSAPLVWSERSVARLFCVPCLSPIFWSLLLQQLACKLEYVGFLYATLPDKELAELLSGMHRKAIFWRTGCLLRSEGYQALVRATPQRVHSPLSSPKPSRGSVDDNSEPALNYIDVLVEASENFVSVKLLQVITQAIVDVSSQTYILFLVTFPPSPKYTRYRIFLEYIKFRAYRPAPCKLLAPSMSDPA